MTFRLIAALVLLVLTAVFAVQNALPVTLTFLAWKFQGSLALVLILSFAAGAAIALLAMLPAFIRKSQAIAGQRKQIDLLRQPPPPPLG